MSICAGIVISVSFQQVNHAPNAETGPDGDHECLQYSNRACEKSHIVSSYYNKVVSTPTFGSDKNDLEGEGA